MTRTVAQIEAEIARLQKEKDAIRAREVAGVIRRIRKAIDYYGLSAAELGFGPAAHAKTGACKSARRLPVKYRGGAGNQWSGRGRRPAWFVAALQAGRSAQELEVR